ncbi:hypothetical protein EMIHUDRAFT_221248 [Emiliania huxleyi CCMP1516]|uniref:Uncharacterized protein n=2 Tax=Emiliania huxleyi TaxID=2903 RepID=A0A0D3HZJ0_EMIH1|nr:hypothetical protein EMIHUDRAFT_221248 [Emiliania huxleyi CCMP1516]EOD04425.1 hypothetical protein EMIHUDRAFT_221248 [Emiliania huxleyi CCMP1516]|eukprot:XP_005756854.1 hypothetical protein EMIHUDRAFT_221248 [Emiliania huxleyi CCMP1516]
MRCARLPPEAALRPLGLAPPAPSRSQADKRMTQFCCLLLVLALGSANSQGLQAARPGRGNFAEKQQQLKAEIKEQLKAEHEQLKAEHEQLKAEHEELKDQLAEFKEELTQLAVTLAKK